MGGDRKADLPPWWGGGTARGACRNRKSRRVLTSLARRRTGFKWNCRRPRLLSQEGRGGLYDPNRKHHGIDRATTVVDRLRNHGAGLRSGPGINPNRNFQAPPMRKYKD
jgi:hypothetical protein